MKQNSHHFSSYFHISGRITVRVPLYAIGLVMGARHVHCMVAEKRNQAFEIKCTEAGPYLLLRTQNQFAQGARSSSTFNDYCNQMEWWWRWWQRWWWFTCEAILQVVRWPRGTGSCFQLLNAPWGSRCKAALNMLVDVASTICGLIVNSMRQSLGWRRSGVLVPILPLASPVWACVLLIVAVAHAEVGSWVDFNEAFQDLDNFEQISQPWVGG